MTTVELRTETLERIKKARELIYEKQKIQLRMPDIMALIISETSEELAEKITKTMSIKMSKEE